MVDKFFTKKCSYQKSAVDLLNLFKNEPYVFLLESSLVESDRGRYSFLSFDPFDIVEGDSEDAVKELKKKFNQYYQCEGVSQKLEWPLSSGIVGFFGYDYGLELQNIDVRQQKQAKAPLCCFGLYDFMVVIDHQEKVLNVVSSGLPETDEINRVKRAEQRLKDVWRRIDCFCQEKTPDRPLSHFQEADIRSNFTKLNYEAAIQKALDYISEGDIYQVNLSQRFSVNVKDEIDAVELYTELRNQSPSCFGAYFKGDGYSIVSSSPERFLSLKGRHVETRPMKGTRPRGRNSDTDAFNKNDMIASAKERAELLMITDLHRNDIGRVCEFGSVTVEALRVLEEYKTVFQTTSLITGTLKKDCHAFDLIDACFPAGSVTGCPKIRSMQVIEEIEADRRGIYTGSLGYIDFSGDMDFNVLIRTLFVEGLEISFHVGGGIVSDSVPALEYEETLVKAQAMLSSLKKITGSLGDVCE